MAARPASPSVRGRNERIDIRGFLRGPAANDLSHLYSELYEPGREKLRCIAASMLRWQSITESSSDRQCRLRAGRRSARSDGTWCQSARRTESDGICDELYCQSATTSITAYWQNAGIFSPATRPDGPTVPPSPSLSPAPPTPSPLRPPPHPA